VIQLVIAIVLVVAGFAGGVKYHAGVIAQRDLQAQQARETDAKQQRQFNDVLGGKHAQAVEKLSDQLGDARAHLARLTARSCLDPESVRVLNATGVLERGAAAGQPARAASAPEAAGGLRWATNVDLGEYIAYCRTQYGKVSGQLNQILDIEDRRHPPAPPTK